MTKLLKQLLTEATAPRRAFYSQDELTKLGAETLVTNMNELKRWLGRFPDIASGLKIGRLDPIGFEGEFDGKAERFDFPFNTGAFFELRGQLPHQGGRCGNMSEHHLIKPCELPHGHSGKHRSGVGPGWD